MHSMVLEGSGLLVGKGRTAPKSLVSRCVVAFCLRKRGPETSHIGPDVFTGVQVKVASIRVGTADWFDSWEQNGSDETQQQKTPKLELLGGARYYLEAEHQGRAPNSGVRIGVQIHNTWLNPDVVSTYLREKHQIRAWAERLPEIQVCLCCLSHGIRFRG